ncbi:hypothetical protein RintRC_5530 [Richelia intracellularis]|nr:hypothetical protein RintRC_5530 [Richelia intracellularis]
MEQVAESGDNFTKFSTISKCFQTLIHSDATLLVVWSII